MIICNLVFPFYYNYCYFYQCKIFTININPSIETIFLEKSIFANQFPNIQFSDNNMIIEKCKSILAYNIIDINESNYLNCSVFIFHHAFPFSILYYCNFVCFLLSLFFIFVLTQMNFFQSFVIQLKAVELCFFIFFIFMFRLKLIKTYFFDKIAIIYLSSYLFGFPLIEYIYQFMYNLSIYN